ncbi:MAG: response regulator [Acidobacteriota bacterium]
MPTEELLLESTADGFYAVDSTGTCTMLNRAAAEMLGYSKAEIVGKNFHEMLHHSRADNSIYPQELCPTHRVMRTGIKERVRGDVFWRKDSTSFQVEYSVAPILDETLGGAVVTFTDVTERALLESQEDKSERLSMLSRLAATMAHEFNNVLMGIQPFSEVIGREAGNNETIRKAVQRISTSLKRGKRVTEQILSFTRKASIVTRPIAFKKWAEELAQEARAILGPGIPFKIDIDDRIVVEGDSGHIQQVFLNLITNARDAMTGGSTLRLEVQPGSGNGIYAFGIVEHVERFAHIKLSDTGSGMSRETMGRVFEPLFTTRRSSTGLGLAVAHQIIVRHGGHIFFESAEGKGTTVHLFLPISTDPVKSEEAVSSAGRSGIRKLVLVEDDPDIAFGLAALLDLEGIEVTVAETGGAALGVIASADPDVVLLDVGLPDMDGSEVYFQIAERWPALPVIFSTGHGDRLRLEEIISKPHIGYLQKPYDLAELLGMLKLSIPTTNLPNQT